MIQEAISKLVEGKSLTTDEAAQVMNEIMEGEVTPAQFGAFVTSLRLKGETVEEIAGMVKTMREKAIPVLTTEPVVDVVGTGGDGMNTFNISTAAAFVVAGAGQKVAKHGNRAASSKSGAADVLEALGVKLDLSADEVKRCIEEVGIGFMFAQAFHPAMKYAGPPRREIGIRTVFNIIGPLTNPAGATTYLLGVAETSLVEKLALVLQSLDCDHALVVHGEDGLDEITLTGKSQVCELKDGKVHTYTIEPGDFGLVKASPDDLKGGDANENAALLKDILSGKKGPQRDIVVMNAAAALVAANKVESIEEGVKQAIDSIDKGQAMDKLKQLVELSQEFAV
ncbi:anthranilate phosphoribosyltransferase [Chloroflexota bacterium]